jgi:hypothetical protein
VKYNGAEPETNVFKIDASNDSGVNRFIPLTQILEECHFLDHVSEGVFPIAWAEGGNYVVIDLEDNGAIYFWDHEEPEIKHKLATNIEHFVSSLEPFESSKVELKEAQVKSIWIDPDFLRENRGLTTFILEATLTIKMKI